MSVATKGTQKIFLDQINALRGAGDRGHALSSSLAAVALPSTLRDRIYERTNERTNERRGERKWRARVPAHTRTYANTHIRT